MFVLLPTKIMAAAQLVTSAHSFVTNDHDRQSGKEWMVRTTPINRFKFYNADDVVVVGVICNTGKRH